MKYFFPLVGPEKIYPDNRGLNFDNLADAQAYAATVASDLRLDVKYQDHAVCIIDEGGRDLARVAV
jgi:hypothetical protein